MKNKIKSNQVPEILDKCSKLLGLDLQFNQVTMDKIDDRKVPAEIKDGVYVITYKESILYAGKGDLRGRRGPHREKLTGVFKDATDPDGWRIPRMEFGPLDPKDCIMYFADGITPFISGALEGLLILNLLPMNNKETFYLFYPEKILEKYVEKGLPKLINTRSRSLSFLRRIP